MKTSAGHVFTATAPKQPGPCARWVMPKGGGARTFLVDEGSQPLSLTKPPESAAAAAAADAAEAGAGVAAALVATVDELAAELAFAHGRTQAAATQVPFLPAGVQRSYTLFSTPLPHPHPHPHTHHTTTRSGGSGGRATGAAGRQVRLGRVQDFAHDVLWPALCAKRPGLLNQRPEPGVTAYTVFWTTGIGDTKCRHWLGAFEPAAGAAGTAWRQGCPVAPRWLEAMVAATVLPQVARLAAAALLGWRTLRRGGLLGAPDALLEQVSPACCGPHGAPRTSSP
jgi:hypothetical protein